MEFRTYNYLSPEGCVRGGREGEVALDRVIITSLGLQLTLETSSFFTPFYEVGIGAYLYSRIARSVLSLATPSAPDIEQGPLGAWLRINGFFPTVLHFDI